MGFMGPSIRQMEAETLQLGPHQNANHVGVAKLPKLPSFRETRTTGSSAHPLTKLFACFTGQWGAVFIGSARRRY